MNRSGARGTGRLLATACIAALVGYASSIAMSPFLIPIATELHVTVALLGQIPAVATAAAAALGLVVGPLADHFGHRRTMLVGLLALVAAELLMRALAGARGAANAREPAAATAASASRSGASSDESAA